MLTRSKRSITVNRFSKIKKRNNFVFFSINRQACWELASQANYHNISGPQCGPDGSFSARQCDKTTSKCSCVTPSGIHIKGFQSQLEDENINCGKRFYFISNFL